MKKTPLLLMLLIALSSAAQKPDSGSLYYLDTSKLTSSPFFTIRNEWKPSLYFMQKIPDSLKNRNTNGRMQIFSYDYILRVDNKKGSEPIEVIRFNYDGDLFFRPSYFCDCNKCKSVDSLKFVRNIFKQ